MSIREFVESLKTNKKTELKSLYKKPVPETGIQVPKAQVFEKDVYQQGDILYLPEDKGYKFLLVIVDLYDNSVDAEPVKDILSKNNDVLEAFKKIYSRKYINPPLILTLDKGAEFTQEKVKNYLKDDLKINVKYALTGRSRQLAYVERQNQRIGNILLKRMASQELITGQVSKEWVDDIKPLIQLFNEKKKTPLKKEISPDPIVNEYTGNLLKIGTKVRLLLDKPVDTVKGKRLIGDFRSGDIRWTSKVYKITEVLLKPGYPPLYLTDADDNVARTKNQLQPVSKEDEEPDARFLRGNPDTYIISKILNKKIENKKTLYLVKWKGFKESEATWEPSSVFDRTKDLKALRKKFNETH